MLCQDFGCVSFGPRLNLGQAVLYRSPGLRQVHKVVEGLCFEGFRVLRS